MHQMLHIQRSSKRQRVLTHENTAEANKDLEMRYHADSASATVTRRHQSAAVII